MVGASTYESCGKLDIALVNRRKGHGPEMTIPFHLLVRPKMGHIDNQMDLREHGISKQ
jgi:hypothetical protein